MSAAAYVQAAAAVGGVTASILETIGKRKQFAANARLLQLQGQVAARETRRAGRILLGTQRAAFAGAGVTVEGTPMDVAASTAEEVELQAQRQIWEFEAAAMEERLQRKLALVQGVAKASSAILSAAGASFDTRTGEFTPRTTAGARATALSAANTQQIQGASGGIGAFGFGLAGVA